ncbi:MAG: Lpg1974 family pore-forming outer membrane protein [Chlamydiota bacterium]|nr:Lpg1974 family pore-forming outer membrane protein [Chlamydiota bacterium]
MSLKKLISITINCICFTVSAHSDLFPTNESDIPNHVKQRHINVESSLLFGHNRSSIDYKIGHVTGPVNPFFSPGFQIKLTTSQDRSCHEQMIQWTHLTTDAQSISTDGNKWHRASQYNLFDLRSEYHMHHSDRMTISPSMGLKYLRYEENYYAHVEGIKKPIAQIWMPGIGPTLGIAIKKELPMHFYFVQSGTTSLLINYEDISEEQVETNIMPYFEISSRLGWSHQCSRSKNIDLYIGWEAHSLLNMRGSVNFHGLKTGLSLSF